MKGYAVYRCPRRDRHGQWQPLDLVRTVSEARYMARHDAEVQGLEIAGWASLPAARGRSGRAWLGTYPGDETPEPASTYLIAELDLPFPAGGGP
jgi:hypothetical protein